MTLDQLQQQRDAILQKMGSEQRVRLSDGREVAEPTQAELADALRKIDEEIAKQSPQSRQFKIQTSRGL